jgi:site-specific DNA-cytosine methylase
MTVGYKHPAVEWNGLTVTDLFCGAGGSSSGLVEAGYRVVIAANHWALAIESHQTNHPETDHSQADISQVDPRYFPTTDVLWASPECTNHSIAKGVKRQRATNEALFELDGTKPLADEAANRSRATMWDVPRFAEAHQYRAIIIENVVDAARWVQYPAWLMAMELLGYRHEIVWMNSMHAQQGGLPAPQSRDRMYVVFWRTDVASKKNPAPNLGRWTQPLPDEAKAWEGWGTALKPAFEPIIVARKPLRGTVAANVLAYGTGALNIDATRVATSDKLGGGAVSSTSDGWDRPWKHDAEAVDAAKERSADAVAKAESLGRFPSNVLLDEAQAAELDRQAPDTGGSGKASGPSLREPTGTGVAFGARNGLTGEPAFYGGEKGGASRFFPTFRYVAKAPGSERPEVDGMAHATVKPLDLMRWLVRLVTRKGGHVLEPFAGSGTTGEAALLEGMRVTLIELEEEHLPLIMQRVRKPLHPPMFADWDDAA